MANLKRKNHFLPECYQKGFADASGKVWVKFADKERPEHRNPSSVGYRSSLYIVKRRGIEDDEVEDFFSNVVEGPFAPISQRIKEEQDRFAILTGDETGALCGFVASQAVRTLAVDPQFVRFLNGRVREQSEIFLLARDKASLS